MILLFRTLRVSWKSNRDMYSFLRCPLKYIRISLLVYLLYIALIIVSVATLLVQQTFTSTKYTKLYIGFLSYLRRFRNGFSAVRLQAITENRDGQLSRVVPRMHLVECKSVCPHALYGKFSDKRLHRRATMLDQSHICVNLLWSSDAIRRHTSWSTLVQLMADRL